MMADLEPLLQRAQNGDRKAITQLLECYREQLHRMITRRLDKRLAARIDASDIVQETLLVAAINLTQFAHQRPMPFYRWLRRLALQRMIDFERRHLRAQRRSVTREQWGHPNDNSSKQELVLQLISRVPDPHVAAVDAERVLALSRALDTLEHSQREILLLHYVEDLTLAEAAELLQITPDAARMRHFRALRSLRENLEVSPHSEHLP